MVCSSEMTRSHQNDVCHRGSFVWSSVVSVSGNLCALVKCVFVLAVVISTKASPSLSLAHHNYTQSPVLNTSLSNRLFNRSKRDEDPASVFGKGVAFFLGEPCENTCNQILFHVWCNLTTHRCECLPEYPVNVDKKYCLKATELEDQCEYSESCQYLTRNSECGENGVCKCMPGFFAKFDESKRGECVAYDSPFHIRIGTTTFDFINNMEFITIFSLTLSFVLIIILFYLVIKLIHKNQQMAKSNDHAIDRIPPPPPVILTEPQYYPSLESSPHSYRNLSLSDKANKYSFVPTALPQSNLGSRRQSLSSLQSQSSIKSYSSMRSQNSYRNYRSSHCPKRQDFYRKASSPLDSFNNNQNYVPNHQLPNSSHMRTKCSNSRCGSGSKVKSEICLVHNTHKLQEELFVPTN